MKPRKLGLLRMALLALMVVGLTGCPFDDGYGPTGEQLALVSRRLQIAEVGVGWGTVIVPTGGTTPYAYEIPVSQRPPGLTFQGDPLKMSITGTPAEAGAYPFTLTVTDAANATVSADFILWVVEEIDLTGTWQYTMTVTVVSGECGEVVGASRTHTLTITQTGDDLVFAGFFGDTLSQLTGRVWHRTSPMYPGVDAIVSGSYPEDGGTLEGRHRLEVYSPTEMAGTEFWRWTGPASACDDSEADVDALRVGP
jgi:hypothetical protein